MRQQSPLAWLVLCGALLGGVAQAQEESKGHFTFVDKLASRFGWGDEDQQGQPANAQEAESRRPSSRPGSTSRLSRFNPGALLPGQIFSGSSNNTTSRNRSNGQAAGGAAGSARARLVRDLRSQPAPAQPMRVASRAPAESPQQPQPKTTATKPSEAEQNATVLSRSSTTRVGSRFVAQQSDSDQAAGESANPQRQAVLSEAALRQELLVSSPLAGADKPRADAQTTKSVAAAVAQSLTSKPPVPAAATKPSVQQILQAETSRPVAAETYAQPDEERSVESPPLPTSQIKSTPVSRRRYAASSLPEFTEKPVERNVQQRAAVAPPIPAEKPKPQVAVDQEPESRPSFEALVESPARESESTELQAQQAFAAPVEEPENQLRVEQSVEARTAPVDMADVWNAPKPPSQPAPKVAVESATIPQDSIGSAVTPRTEADLLMSQRMPQIVSRVSGPRTIVVGREALYRVTIANRGEETADQLVTQITVPEWAEVASARSSVGLIEPPKTDDSATRVLWRVAELRAGNTQQMDLRLIARQGRPIELGVDWKHAPVGSRAVVEVQEPKLNLAIEGPGEVLFGKQQRFRAHVSNPGTGAAENVVLQLFPLDGTSRTAATHSLGELKPNEVRTVDFNMLPGEAGQLQLRAQVSALGDLSHEVEKEVFCRKAELEVDWRGPKEKYSGAPATYYFRVRNPGTATATGVKFGVSLPAGFEFTKASGDGKPDAAGRQVVWNVGSLRPGDDYYMELCGAPSRAGENRFEFAASDADRIATSSAVAATNVIAVADLKLQIADPKGPLPVGKDVVYEVRVLNRGAGTASQIDIVGLFSEGIEPYQVDGAEYNISDGRVAIRTVESLTAGSELLLKIRAKAVRAGAHVFRAEVLCRDLDIKLAAEETTRFYTEEPINLGDRSGSPGFGDRR